MPMSGKQLVDQSVEMWTRAQRDQQLELYQRLEAHYSADLEGETYFPRYYRETQERYDKRPKEVLPLCSAVVDVLAGAMVGDGVQVTIGKPDSTENTTYQEIQRHNDLDGANALAIGQVAGVFGWAAERILLMGSTPADRQVEFERVNPMYFLPVYDHGAIGRTIKRVNGLTFQTLWDPDSGTAIPRDTAVGAADKSVRTEIITPTEWWVYLDGEPQPTNPLDPDVRWMPLDNGRNPYGVIPVSLLWNIHHITQFQGRSDVDPGYRMAEELNRIYSQMLYNLQMLFPTLTVPKAGVEGNPSLGLGLALEYPLDGPAPGWIVPPLDVSVFMEPLKAMLTLFFSGVHTPASSHGLGTIFGQQSHESGVAKFYENAPLLKHVSRKRTNFVNFVETRYRNLAAVLNQPAPHGWGLNLDLTAEVDVEFTGDVVPVSDQELTERIILRLKNHIISDVEAILESRGWEDTPENREKVQTVLDDIGKAATSKQPTRPLDAALKAQLDAAQPGGGQ